MGLWQKIRAAFASDDDDAEPTNASARETPEEQFTSLVLALTRALPFVTSAEPHPHKAFTLSVGLTSGGEAAELYLGNIFAETRELSPEDRRTRVLGLLTALEPADPLAWDEARQALVPLLRSVGYVTAAGRAVANEPFAPFLVVALGIDRESTTQVVTEEALTDWGVSFETARDSARDVLMRHAGPADIELWDRETGYPIFAVGRDDGYQTSRLTLPGFLASFRDRVRGNPIAIVPHRTLMVVSGDADAAAVLRLLRTAEREYRASPRALSPDLYTVDAEGRVTPWEPPLDHPHRALVHNNRLLLAVSEYSQQRERLVEELAERGDDVFVASYGIAMPHDESLPVSYSVLAENVPTLLPLTELIAFAARGSESSEPSHLFVRFEAARRIASELFVPEPGLVPERVRASGWPDRETLNRLAEAAVELSSAESVA